MYSGRNTNTPSAWDQYTHSNFRRPISPSRWDSGYMQREIIQRPITSQDVYPMKNSFEIKEDVEAGDHKSDGCCSGVIQCSQETSFSGLKYIGGNESTMIRR